MAWRDSMRSARFLGFDARLLLAVVAFLLFIGWLTFTILVLSLVFFWALERRGLTVPAALRAMRVRIIGAFRPAHPSIKRRRLKDNGFC